MSHLHALMLCVWLSSTTLLSSLCWPSSLLSSCPSSCPSTSSSTMRWTNSLCTLANEDLGTLAEYDPLTGYEPNVYHITEATEPYIQESSVENGHPNDFEYDDVTIGQALSLPLFTQEREGDASRRRAYHSQEEGLSSCLSSSVSHDRTVRPVVCTFDSQVSSVQETQRHSSESEQIRILLERRTERILADCQAEIRKHEVQADYDRRSIQKLNEMIESSKKKKFVVLIRRTTSTRSSTSSWTAIEAKLDLREAHDKKPQWDGRIEAISRLNIRHNCEDKIGRRSRYYPWTHSQDTGISEWN